MPLRLRHQSRQVAVLLFSPWLLTILLFRPLFLDQPVTMLGLLPGLAAALHVQWYLSHHLATNHRRFEEDRLYSTLGAANWITLLRACAVVTLAGFLPLALQRGSGQFNADALTWAPGLIYLGISLADLLDGFVARRQGRETELGKRLDIVTDAAGLLVASLLAVILTRLPVVSLLVGLAYYPFIFGIWLRQRRALPVVALQSRPYARIIAGCQMGLVGMALLPIFHPSLTFIAAYIVMTPLLLGFLRDWLVVSCQVKTVAGQQASLDLWVKSLAIKVPVALRLAILSCGIITFAYSDVYQAPLSWQLAHSFCCLLAGLGFMGRSAGLALVLMIAVNQSPFGITAISIVTFGTAAALMLTGTGIMSLWAPEERILYRR